MKFLMLLIAFAIVFYFKEEIVYGIKSLFCEKKKENEINDKPIEEYTLGEIVTMAWRKAKYCATHKTEVTINSYAFVTRSLVSSLVALGLLGTYLCVDGNDVKLSYTIIGVIIFYLVTEFKNTDSDDDEKTDVK